MKATRHVLREETQIAYICCPEFGSGTFQDRYLTNRNSFVIMLTMAEMKQSENQQDYTVLSSSLVQLQQKTTIILFFLVILTVIFAVGFVVVFP